MTVNAYETEHRDAVRALAPECTVLLRASGAFPLAGPCRLALYGNGARRTIMGGTGSGEVNVREFVTCEQGLEAAGFTVTTKAWLDGYDRIYDEAHRAFLAEIRERARKKHTPAIVEGMGAVMPEPACDLPLTGDGDAAVYVLSRISGEGSDRRAVEGDLLLSESERRDILTLRERFDRFMLVLNVGGPVDLSPLDGVDDILLLSQLGIDTGNVLADLLTGKAYPSGKLTTTWSAWGGWCDVGEFGEREDTRYREGVYVGYRFFDSVGRKPMFPFGFGLGYTAFDVACAGIRTEGTELLVDAAVRNTGKYRGREVVQLYISSPGRTLDVPFQSLAAFAKTRELAPDESETVTLSCKVEDLASYDTVRQRWFLDGGDYLLRLGTSSADASAYGVLRLDGDVVTRAVRNRCGVPDFADWKPERRRTEEASADLPVVTVCAAAIETEEVDYNKSISRSETARLLSDGDLAKLCVGAHESGLTGVIGDAGRSVAGAAGETSLHMRERGVGSIVMADGPAGLRLSRRYTVDKKGVAHSLDGSMPQSMLELLTPAQAAGMRLLSSGRTRVRGEVREQYATALPIGTALAQSWDLALAERCGDIVGDEMERFGVDLWLAPALNIHRDVRCGRNFEYFSEDPLVSGLFAAAITRGVQKHPGRGVTVKHFAANNQETNRYNNSSQVSERAMREIYLRGFELCLRESRPAALMTSYNLLNGVHTSEHSGLVTDILRCEFGFDGLVMTDWITARGIISRGAKYPAPAASRICAAGGDLMMPGERADVADLLRALKTGRLRREQLERAAEHILKVLKQCGKG